MPVVCYDSNLYTYTYPEFNLHFSHFLEIFATTNALLYFQSCHSMKGPSMKGVTITEQEEMRLW